ncbi:MAG: 50S ribosome-binding GTPase [Candidatus Thermoplasmatota archaeon]|nr:50S ribosome-binding GTPase [Candidatus Thermoplasmatota archaeon]
MYKTIPPIATSQELIDRAFARARKKTIQDPKKYFRKKKTYIARTESFTDTLSSVLESYIKQFPSLDQLPQFYQELIHNSLNLDSLRHSLGAIQWAKDTIDNIATSQTKTLRRSTDLQFIHKKQREIHGRCTSIIKQINADFQVLRDARDFIVKLPDIQDIPTIVIAGYPNVGKSSLLSCLSRAKPHIAQYPFTTKTIQVGHMKQRTDFFTEQFQIIDTPGLLEQPDEERNEIEQVAIIALSNLADIVIYLLDPSESCGYTLIQQQQLLSRLKQQFTNAEFIIVKTKNDLYDADEQELSVSCITNDGIDELRSLLFSHYPRD